MMGFFDRLFGNKQPGDDDQPASMPWDQRPSIYDHVRSYLDSATSGLAEGGQSLPDEERNNAGSQIRWAAGALDGVVSHHLGTGDTEEKVAKTVNLVVAFCGQPTALNKAAIYQNIIQENTVSIIDPVIEALASEERINHQRLYELAYSFATEAPDREPVKFGIAILGLFGQAGNEELFQTLGRHDEFTLFCGVALSNTSDDPDGSLWRLARHVDGWGRIQVVERLSQTENPAIKDWLLREGYRNSVMYEYLAYTCATAGGLMPALSAGFVDRELLTSAGELIEALIMGGPAQCIDDYEDGALAVEMYLGHIDSSADTLDDFIHVNTIKQFLDDEAEWDARAECGWTNERRDRLRAICDRVLQRSDWEDQARSGLSSNDELEFHRANQVAEALGIDTWEQHWNRLQQKPDDSSRWSSVMARCSDERIGQAVEFAERNIALSRIATGAAGALGIGPGFEPHLCLDFVVQKLGRFPGQGEKLIETGLKSPAVRSRNTATATLAAWGRENWSEAISRALQAASRAEPDDEVRQRMNQVLNGQPIEE